MNSLPRSPVHQSLPLMCPRGSQTLLPPSWRRGPDDPDVLERHEVIGVVRGHDTILLPESAPSTRGEGAGAPAQVALRGSERARMEYIDS